MQTEARASSPPESLSPEQRASYVFLTVVTVISLAADLVSKGWAKARLTGFDPQKLAPRKIEIIKDHLDFIYALNPGGAWSFLRGLPDSLRRPFFLFVSASAIVFIISIYRRVPTGHRAMRWGLPLALGGAMGNLVDRIRYGSVIDFIDVYIKRGGREHHWPTFNVADIAIVVGVGLMVIDMLLPVRKADLGTPSEIAEAQKKSEPAVTAPLSEIPLVEQSSMTVAELLSDPPPPPVDPELVPELPPELVPLSRPSPALVEEAEEAEREKNLA
jgi:signal peptidase II